MKTFMLAAVLCLAAAPPAKATSPDAFIEAYARDHAFSGSVLVQAGGKIRYAGSFGLADIAFEIPNDARTRYPIASITKLFTSALILQLRDEGRLDLDRSVRTYLPDYPGEAADKVTVRQLLNHTSGLPSYDGITDAASAMREGMPVYQLPHDSDSLLARYASGKLVSAPGTKFEYNNADYIVLGKIVERLRGETFDQALRQYLLQPLGLQDSGMLRQDTIVPRLAGTYFHRSDKGPLTPDLPSYPENWYASGAMYATPRDLLVFANALFGGKILGKDSLAQLLAPGLDDYGLGLWVYEAWSDGRAHRVAKRPGRIMGANTQLYRFLDCDLTVIVLANTDAVDTDDFVARVGSEVLRTAVCAKGG
ncbi:MAG TPA: serine hydrolase domain-containing protein [Pseudoxanthomonas sp.]|nr:serine hydrolase domain-containing protein [Pseudoxanthomonas sp.]